jgi:hypothetical protein
LQEEGDGHDEFCLRGGEHDPDSCPWRRIAAQVLEEVDEDGHETHAKVGSCVSSELKVHGGVIEAAAAQPADGAIDIQPHRFPASWGAGLTREGFGNLPYLQASLQA